MTLCWRLIRAGPYGSLNIALLLTAVLFAIRVINRRTRRLFPFIGRIYGDGDYQGPKAEGCRPRPVTAIEIVERFSTAVGFEVLPKAGSSNAPLPGRFRRLARDFERYARTVACSSTAMIRFVLKRLVASSSS